MTRNSGRVLRLLLWMSTAVISAAQTVSSQPAVPIEPVAAILDAFRTYHLVAVGGAHGHEQGDAFALALVREPRFAAVVNDVLVESGNARYQDVMDRFVEGADVPAERLRQIWLNTTQPQAVSFEMPQLFRVVRAVNTTLPRGRRLRILLGDPPIDWDNIRTAEQLRAWQADAAHDRDRYAADLVRREVLMKRRRALAIYGAGHVFRRNVSHSLVSLLEAADTLKTFTIWTNTGSDLDAIQADVASWRVPSLALVRGTTLGAANFTSYFPPGMRAELPPEWRVPMEDQFDAVLYVGPLSAMSAAGPVPPRCDDPAHAEQLRRMALSPWMKGLIDGRKRKCTSDARK